jgi:hypothetical protein
MRSEALGNFLSALREVDALQRANPSPQEGSGLRLPEIVRAIGRAEVVLLSSHFERYIYALTEEAVGRISDCGGTAGTLPAKLKLEHSRLSIEAIAATQWDRRGELLEKYTSNESWLWDAAAPIEYVDPERLLTWMKTPNAKALVKVFQLWGIQDIFKSITKKSTIQGHLRLRIDELVSKRNNIAHGDLTVQATYLDVVQYRAAVRTFCTRADRALARHLVRFVGERPW